MLTFAATKKETATDVGALRSLSNESLCMTYQEEIAVTLRPFFATQ